MANDEQQPPKPSFEERIEALIMNAELFSRDLEQFRAEVAILRESTANLVITSKQDGENIRALACIAEIHERRLTAVEGNSAPAD